MSQAKRILPWSKVAAELKVVDLGDLAYFMRLSTPEDVEALRESFIHGLFQNAIAIIQSVIGKPLEEPQQHYARRYERRGDSKRTKDNVQVSSVAVYNDKGQLLMLQRSDDDKWNCPGGHLEPGEDPKDAAKREMKEETGLDANGLELVGQALLSNGIQVYSFRTKISAEEAEKLTGYEDPDHESKAFQWVDPTAIPPHILKNLHNKEGDVTLQALCLQPRTIEGLECFEENGDKKTAEFDAGLSGGFDYLPVSFDDSQDDTRPEYAAESRDYSSGHGNDRDGPTVMDWADPAEMNEPGHDITLEPAEEWENRHEYQVSSNERQGKRTVKEELEEEGQPRASFPLKNKRKNPPRFNDARAPLEDSALMTGFPLELKSSKQAAFQTWEIKDAGGSVIAKVDTYSLVNAIKMVATQPGGLSNADFQGADLKQGKFARCKFSNCNFANADLSSSDCFGATFQGCNLQSVNLVNSALTHANLTGSDLTGADLSKTILDTTNFKDTLLEGVKWDEARLKNPKFLTVKTPGAHKTGAKMNPKTGQEDPLAKGNRVTKVGPLTKKIVDESVPYPGGSINKDDKPVYGDEHLAKLKKALLEDIETDLLRTPSGLTAQSAYAIDQCYEKWLHQFKAEAVLRWLRANRESSINENLLPQHREVLAEVLKVTDLTGNTLLEASKDAFWNEFVEAAFHLRDEGSTLIPDKLMKRALFEIKATPPYKFDPRGLPESVLRQTKRELDRKEQEGSLSAEDEAAKTTLEHEEEHRGEGSDELYELPDQGSEEITETPSERHKVSEGKETKASVSRDELQVGDKVLLKNEPGTGMFVQGPVEVTEIFKEKGGESVGLDEVEIEESGGTRYVVYIHDISKVVEKASKGGLTGFGSVDVAVEKLGIALFGAPKAQADPASMPIGAMKTADTVELDPVLFEEEAFTQGEHALGALSVSRLEDERPSITFDQNILLRKAIKQLSKDLRTIRGPYTVQALSLQRMSADRVSQDGVPITGKITWHARIAAHRFQRIAAFDLEQPIVDGEPQAVQSLTNTAGVKLPFNKDALEAEMKLPAKAQPSRREPRVERALREES